MTALFERAVPTEIQYLAEIPADSNISTQAGERFMSTRILITEAGARRADGDGGRSTQGDQSRPRFFSEEYKRTVIEHIGDHPISPVYELLPWAVSARAQQEQRIAA
jgi:hypothetical protein